MNRHEANNLNNSIINLRSKLNSSPISASVYVKYVNFRKKIDEFIEGLAKGESTIVGDFGGSVDETNQFVVDPDKRVSFEIKLKEYWDGQNFEHETNFVPLEEFRAWTKDLNDGERYILEKYFLQIP